MTDFKPTGDGQSPLAKVRNGWKSPIQKQAKKALRETNTMPQWAGSCWYYLRFCDPHNDKEAWEPKKRNIGCLSICMWEASNMPFCICCMPAFGIKCSLIAVWCHTLEPFHDLAQSRVDCRTLVSKEAMAAMSTLPMCRRKMEATYFDEQPAKSFAVQIEKMSKSKLNGITPDDIIEEFGADSLRLYEMFMGPLEKEKIWNTDAVTGCRRFLNRFYDMATSEKLSDEESRGSFETGPSACCRCWTRILKSCSSIPPLPR